MKSRSSMLLVLFAHVSCVLCEPRPFLLLFSYFYLPCCLSLYPSVRPLLCLPCFFLRSCFPGRCFPALLLKVTFKFFLGRIRREVLADSRMASCCNFTNRSFPNTALELVSSVLRRFLLPLFYYVKVIALLWLFRN